MSISEKEKKKGQEGDMYHAAPSPPPTRSPSHPHLCGVCPSLTFSPDSYRKKKDPVIVFFLCNNRNIMGLDRTCLPAPSPTIAMIALRCCITTAGLGLRVCLY